MCWRNGTWGPPTAIGNIAEAAPVAEYHPAPPPVPEIVPPRKNARRDFPGLGDWARMVKERDGSCVACGKTDGLHAHHIKPKAAFPDLALDLENGESRCAPCHRLAHPELPEFMFVRGISA